MLIHLFHRNGGDLNFDLNITTVYEHTLLRVIIGMIIVYLFIFFFCRFITPSLV